jgi:hypothetical protein
MKKKITPEARAILDERAKLKEDIDIIEKRLSSGYSEPLHARQLELIRAEIKLSCEFIDRT